MKRLLRIAIFGIMVLSFSLAVPSFNVAARPLAVHAPTLGAADSFAILAATAITDATPASTTINGGDVGSTGGGAAIGIACASMNGGTIFAVDAAGPLCATGNSSVPGNAQAANTAAFGDLIATDNSTCTSLAVGNFDLSGSNLVAGVYCAGTFTLTGTLTLNGTGVWIFQSGSTLITSGTANVVGGDPCSVWWRLPSDTAAGVLGTGTELTGNILALGSITIASGATLNGRAFSQIGAVTLDGDTINRGPLCTTTPGGGVSGLPDTGGAPIQNGALPWTMVIVGAIIVLALGLGVWTYRRNSLPKQ